MSTWRKQRSDNHKHDVTRPRSQNKKPPLGSWQPTVPSWEKKFCSSVGLVSWRKIVETKKIMHLYENVVKWNDSASKEAFYNAKNRFYAGINGLPCDISLPDPDTYIDKIDWDSKIDPELLLDLEREFVVPALDGDNEHVVIFGTTLLADQGFSSMGWGESEEVKKPTISSSDNNENPWEPKSCQDGTRIADGWGDRGNNLCLWNNGDAVIETTGWGNSGNNNSSGWNEGNEAMGNAGWGYGWNQYGGGWGESEEVKKPTLSSSDNKENPWEPKAFEDDWDLKAEGWENTGNGSRFWDNGNAAMEATGWENDYNNNPWCWNEGGEAIGNSGWGYGWDQYGSNTYESGIWNHDSSNRLWTTWDATNNRKREGTGRYIPRYKSSSRSPGDDYHRNHGWRSGKERRRGNFAPEQPTNDRRPSSTRWNLINSCGTVSQHA